jgi:hypothetical protein
MELYEACEQLAGKYQRGEDVPKSERRARALLEPACNAGLGNACSELGSLVYRGEGGPMDPARGIELIATGCTLHEERACKSLAQLCKEGHDQAACERLEPATSD